MYYRPAYQHCTLEISSDRFEQVAIRSRMRVRWGISGRKYHHDFPSSMRSKIIRDQRSSRSIRRSKLYFGAAWSFKGFGSLALGWYSLWRSGEGGGFLVDGGTGLWVGMIDGDMFTISDMLGWGIWEGLWMLRVRLL